MYDIFFLFWNFYAVCSVGIVEQCKTDAVSFQDFIWLIVFFICGLYAETCDMAGIKEPFCKINALSALIKRMVCSVCYNIKTCVGNSLSCLDRSAESRIIAI